MAPLIPLALVAAICGVLCGAYIKICLAIRREDRARTLPFDAPDKSARSARSLVGVNGSRWE
jgi:hypothetical protein